ncbi:MAG: hypothetical protein AAFQ36_09330 [Pseudomonadota bacterium]
MIDPAANASSQPLRVLCNDEPLAEAVVGWLGQCFGDQLSPIDKISADGDVTNTRLLIVYPAFRPFLSRALEADIKPSRAVALWQEGVAPALAAITKQPGLCFTVPDERLVGAPEEVATAFAAWAGMSVLQVGAIDGTLPGITTDPALKVILRQAYDAAREGRAQEAALSASGIAAAGFSRPSAADVDALSETLQSGQKAQARVAELENDLTQQTAAFEDLHADLQSASAERARLEAERGGFLDLLKTAEVALAAAAEGRATLTAQIEATKTDAEARAALELRAAAQDQELASLREALESAQATPKPNKKDARVINRLRKRGRVQENALAEREAEIETLRTSLQELVTSEERLRQSLDELRQDSIRVERRSRAVEIRAAEIESSTSWRVTAPLRVLSRALRPNRPNND